MHTMDKSVTYQSFSNLTFTFNHRVIQGCIVLKKEKKSTPRTKEHQQPNWTPHESLPRHSSCSYPSQFLNLFQLTFFNSFKIISLISSINMKRLAFHKKYSLSFICVPELHELFTQAYRLNVLELTANSTI